MEGSRTRSRVTSAPSEPTALLRWNAGGTCTEPTKLVRAPTSDIYGADVPYSLTESFTDVVTPDYYLRSQAGEIINNGLSRTRVDTWLQSYIGWYEARLRWEWRTCGSTQKQVVYQGQRRTGSLPSNYFGLHQATPAPTPDLPLESLKDRALTNAYAKCEVQEAQGLVILAEGKSTIKSIASIMYRLYRLVKALRHWDVGWMKRQLSARKLSELWMEGRYFIRPLCKDMSDCVKALNKTLPLGKTRQTFRSGSNDTGSNDQSNVMYYDYAGYYRMMCTKSTQRVVSVRSGVLAALEDVSQASVWGLDRPLEMLWEIVPFSFVVDWFLNVGKTIASWTPKAGIRALASWLVVEDTISRGLYHSGFENYWAPTNVWENQISCGSGAYIFTVTKTTERIPNPLRSIIPSFQVRLDAAKLIDLAIWIRALMR